MLYWIHIFSFVIPAWPESLFKVLNKSEGFPTSGNDNETACPIFRCLAVSTAGITSVPYFTMNEKEAGKSRKSGKLFLQ
jgi:hypothetical protein